MTFSITAEDSANQTVPGYAGTVKITSTDPQATFNGNPLPQFYTFNSSDAGSHSFSVLLGTAGSKTVTVTDQNSTGLTATTNPINVVAGQFSKYVDTINNNQQPLTFTAGASFIFTVQATDAYGNAVTSYPATAPTTVTTTTSPVDPLDNASSFQTNFTGNGFWLCSGTLFTVGTYTLQTTGTSSLGSFHGVSPSLAVTPTNASFFNVAAPPSVTTGVPFQVTVTAKDTYGNVVSNYASTVKLQANDPLTTTLISSYQFTTGPGGDDGIHTFSVTLKNAGTEMVQAVDTVSTNPIIQGFSKSITTNGLQVSAFTPTPTGFIATFNKAFLPADLTLYSQNKNVVMDVALAGKNEGPIHGSLVMDPTNSTITFNATASYLKELNANATPPTDSAVLPDDVYTVTLVSGNGSNGFQDALGHLDGLANNTHANFVTTFTTTYQPAQRRRSVFPISRTGPGGFSITAASENASNVVTVTTSIIPNIQAGTQIIITGANPSTYNGTYTVQTALNNTFTFAAPPNLGTYVSGGLLYQAIQVPNDTAKGIPVTFYNAASVGSAAFTLAFNPEMLQIAGGFGGAGSDATDQTAPATAFALVGINTIDATHAVASFTFQDATPQTGTVVLGDILAFVPATNFAISAISETGNTVTVTTSANNNFIQGQAIAINNVNSTVYDSNANGNTLFTITGILAPNKFTYNLPSAANKPSSTGGIAGVAALGLYQQKDLLQLGNIFVNGSTSAATLATSALHVNAYLGDVGTPDGVINGVDTLAANNVALGNNLSLGIPATGFTSYQLIDPVVVGDVAGDLSVDAGDVSDINNFVAVLRNLSLQIPQPPGIALSSPNSADPTISLVNLAGSPYSFAVTLDNADPAGSTGLNEAMLALSYDPSALSVTTQDITLGTLPGQGAGWQISATVDQATGQIGIDLFSATPITATTGGSLVNITFHVAQGSGRSGANSLVQLVSTATIDGQAFSTLAADSEGRFALETGTSSVAVPLPFVVPQSSAPLTATSDSDSVPKVTLADDVKTSEATDAESIASITHESGRQIPGEFILPPAPPPGNDAAAPPVFTFQIGMLPVLNTLLYQNNPWEQNLRQLLPALTRWADAQGTFAPLGDTLAQWLGESTAQPETLQPELPQTTGDAPPPADTPPAADPPALLDQISRLAEEMADW